MKTENPDSPISRKIQNCQSNHEKKKTEGKEIGITTALVFPCNECHSSYPVLNEIIAEIKSYRKL